MQARLLRPWRTVRRRLEAGAQIRVAPPRGAFSAGEPEAGTAVVRIDFELAPARSPNRELRPPASARRFLQLLQFHPSYRLLSGQGPSSLVLIVRFSYHSAVELSRMYDQLLWLLELSRRTTPV